MNFDKKITVCLTSCNRFDLLSRTLKSFFTWNTYPIEKFIITEDSTNPEMKKLILDRFGNKIELIFNETNLGLYRSIDNMYKQVTTEYIFHTEDDWEYNGNNHFIQESLSILEERKDLHQVWVRKDYQNNVDFIEPQVLSTKDNVNYKMVKTDCGGGWGGFNHNPGLRLKVDYDNMFPNGYAGLIIKDKPAVFTEHACSIHAGKLGYRAATLLNSPCVHIGGGRTTL